MPEMIKKDAFLELIRSSHDQIEATWNNLPHQLMEKMRCPGEWSIKDIIAHIVWYETEMVKVLETRSLQGSDWWDYPLDKRNELIHQKYLIESLESMIENENIIFHKMLDLLAGLSENDLNDPAAFNNMPADWQPWSVIASNTNEHYLEHIQQIKDCLKGGPLG